MNAASKLNPFQRFFGLGFRYLVPITPPGAAVHERSHLAKRPGVLGKAPGVRRDDGLWTGLKDWQTREAVAADLDAWHVMGAGVGLRLGLQHDGTVLAGIDADTLHRPSAQLIRTQVESFFGLLPIRIGRSPKAMYLARLSGVVPYRNLAFDEGVVEILCAGKQCVVEGPYPGQDQPYHFTRSLPALADMRVFDPAEIGALLAALSSALPGAGAVYTEGGGDRANADQQALKGSPELVRRALSCIPNTFDNIGYHPWIKVAAALRGACADDFELGLDLFEEWSLRAGADPAAERYECPRHAYKSVKAPFSVGAPWLYEQAEKAGGFVRSTALTIDIADRWFDVAALQSGERAAETSALFGGSDSDDVFEMLSLREILHMPDPRFVIARHIPEQSVGFLYGDPGTGKSFIALDWALHLAFGKGDWHGDAVEADPAASVIYLAGEGAQGMKTRVRAWARRHGVSEAELEDGRFQLIRRGVNMMQPEQVVKLARTIKRGVSRASFVVADTVSRSMPGADENAQKEMTLFVKACDVLRDAFECVVLGVHHSSKKGDMRGSTVLLGAGDFVFKLERAKGATIGKLICEKQKDAPDGWDDPYRFDVVDVPGGSSLVPSRCATSAGPDIPLTPDLSASVLEAMRAAWTAGEPWGATYHAGERHAPRRMVREFGFTAEKAEELVALWLGMGLIVEDTASTKTKKRGFRVVGDIQTDIRADDLFD